MRLRFLLIIALLANVGLMQAQKTPRETIRLDKGWKFAFGNAADPKKDFGCGTEYFNYLTKANSIHNQGPYILKFDDSAWQDVQIPHDWVAALPYASEASHSHGYKTVGSRNERGLVQKNSQNRQRRFGQASCAAFRRHFPQFASVVQRILYGHRAERICHSGLRHNAVR